MFSLKLNKNILIKFMNIFYSQIGEDILIYNNYINKIKNDGTYIEIGASDGLTYSNTKIF